MTLSLLCSAQNVNINLVPISYTPQRSHVIFRLVFPLTVDRKVMTLFFPIFYSQISVMISKKVQISDLFLSSAEHSESQRMIQ